MAPVVRSVRGRSRFHALARPDGRASRGAVSVAFALSDSPDAPDAVPAVAYAIGRRHGNAVRRNRVRRRLRAAVAAAAPGLPPGAYLLRARPEAATIPFGTLCRDVAAAAAAAAAAPRAGTTAGSGRTEESTTHPGDRRRTDREGDRVG